MSTMLIKALNSKIVKIFGVEIWGKAPNLLKTLMFNSSKIKFVKIPVHYNLSLSRFYIHTEFCAIV